MSDVLSRFPKTRPPLPAAYQAIHEAHYIANRTAAYRTTTVSSRLEAWMHRRVADDVRVAPAAATLEIGAGTLNHLRFEPRSAPYDIVEPFTRLFADAPDRGRIRDEFASIDDVPTGRRYPRIVSIATFEHLVDLPAVVARAAVLLAPEGSLRVGIPNEGTLLWRLGTLVTGAEFRLRHGLDYATLMRHEHVNTADEIEAVLRHVFSVVRTSVCGVSRRLALYRSLACRRPRLARAEAILATRGTRSAA
jgi:hypothetical protein